MKTYTPPKRRVDYRSRFSTLHTFIVDRSTRDEWAAFGERAKAKIASLGGGRAMKLEGDAAVQFLAFMETEAEAIAGVK